MKVSVRLFARARDLAGADTIEVDVPAGTTVGHLRLHLAMTRPALAGILERCAVGVNEEFAGDAVQLPADAEIALLPPVSGG